ncbi:MAG: CbtA family protein [Amphritea sp.]
MAIRNILLSAIVVGILSGLLYGLFQHSQISPIIYAAEVYEVAEEEAPEAAVAGHSHSHQTDTQDHHAAEPWGPEDGFERIAYTVSADIAVAIAFAMIMISLMALHNHKANKPKVNVLFGAAWGVAALLSFFVAPAMFGLHPEVPGTEAAVLDNRQAWWLFCALASVAGIAIVYYAPKMFKLAGVALILAPHIIGAPMPEHHGFANTDPAAVLALTDLTQQFFIMTAVGMAIFFVLVGSLSGYAVQRYVKL